MIGSIAGILLAAVAALVGLAWGGLRVAPRRFPAAGTHSRDLGSVPIPSDLPPPVARFARVIFGERMPVVDSAVVVGRATIRRGRLMLRARIKFSHAAKGDYYHYIQVTWFGLPVATINERYLDGTGTMDIPGAHIENDANINHAANQGFWSEALAWLPSVVLTDPRLRWEGVDDTTARLILPNAAAEEVFTVRFDPLTGLISTMTTLRYQDPVPAPRLRWTNRSLEWGVLNGVRVPVRADTQWNDDPPWAAWEIEQVLYNVPVDNRLRQFGGAYPPE